MSVLRTGRAFVDEGPAIGRLLETYGEGASAMLRGPGDVQNPVQLPPLQEWKRSGPQSLVKAAKPSQPSQRWTCGCGAEVLIAAGSFMAGQVGVEAHKAESSHRAWQRERDAAYKAGRKARTPARRAASAVVSLPMLSLPGDIPLDALWLLQDLEDDPDAAAAALRTFAIPRLTR